MKTVLGFADSEELLMRTGGALQDAGFASESVATVRDGDARIYAQICADGRSMQPGEYLVVVRTADEHAQRAMNVLRDAGVQEVKLCPHAEQRGQ